MLSQHKDLLVYVHMNLNAALFDYISPSIQINVKSYSLLVQMIKHYQL